MKFHEVLGNHRKYKCIDYCKCPSLLKRCRNRAVLFEASILNNELMKLTTAFSNEGQLFLF